MSSSYQTRGPMVIESYNALSNYTSTSDSGSYEFVETINKSNTVRRVRPAILWQNPTSLNRETITELTTYGTLRQANGSYYRAPCTVWASAGFESEISNFVIEPHEISGQLRAKIKDQNVNLAQSLAEYRQVSTMFIGAARDILGTLRSLRNGRALRELVRVLENPRTRADRLVANYWLQYQYGLKPLISDIYGVAESMTKKLQEGVLMSVSAQRASRKEKTTNYFVSGTPVERFGAAESQIHGKAYYTIRDANLKGLTAYGILNPLHLGWELIPFSFVVDWLIPVGSYLSSLDALNGTSAITTYYVRRDRRSGFTSIHGGTHQVIQTSYTRFTGGSLPMPQLSYQPSTSYIKVANGIALLTSIRRL